VQFVCSLHEEFDEILCGASERICVEDDVHACDSIVDVAHCFLEKFAVLGRVGDEDDHDRRCCFEREEGKGVQCVVLDG